MAGRLTDLILCNRALLLLGAKKVTAIDGTDTSYRALLCQELYALKKSMWLTEHPWRFNMMKMKLTAAVTTPVNEWDKQYPLPTDGVTNEPYAVFNSDQPGARPIAGGTMYEIFGTDLFTNEATIVIDYQCDIDEDEWPIWFVQFALADLISELALPITDQQNTADSWAIKARGNPSEMGEGGLKAQATFANASMNGSGMINSDELLAVRHGGSYEVY